MISFHHERIVDDSRCVGRAIPTAVRRLSAAMAIITWKVAGRILVIVQLILCTDFSDSGGWSTKKKDLRSRV